MSDLQQELEQELNSIIEQAECGIANERLGGNIAKQEHWKGQRFVAVSIMTWLKAREKGQAE